MSSSRPAGCVLQERKGKVFVRFHVCTLPEWEFPDGTEEYVGERPLGGLKIGTTTRTMRRKTVPKSFTGNTLISVVIDRSGSMVGVRNEVISGYNQWRRATLDAGGQDYPTTLILFDTAITTLCGNQPLAESPQLDYSSYAPSGFTALNDAIAHAIRVMKGQIKKKDRAIVCIITDGQENASKEFSIHTAGTHRIRSLIQECEATGRWTFSYLSASPSAFTDSADLGVSKMNTLSFQATPDDTTRAWATMSSAVVGVAQSARASSKSLYGLTADDTSVPGDSS